jgi:ferritin
MMAYFESRSLTGFGHWMRLQAQEEAAHAMRLVDFLLDRGGHVELQAIERPTVDFDSPLAVMQAALAHERMVTGTINELYAVAVQHNDYPAQVLMQWFVSEQVEEEKNAGEIVDQLELAGGSASALLVLDGRLAERNPETPAPEAG